ncbi:MAG: hypothetical protein IIW48_03095 [Clostridia bacterium]|nr:hypothetical protein [Clostridia bacterium]
MKIKALVAGVMMVLTSFLLVACGKAEDGKITTTTSPITTTSRLTSTTREGIKEEMSSMAGDVSEGMSEAGSKLRDGITRLYE